MGRVLPVEIFNLVLGQSRQFGIDIPLVTLLVVVDLPEVEGNAQYEDNRGCCQIEAVSDRVVRSVERQDFLWFTGKCQQKVI